MSQTGEAARQCGSGALADAAAAPHAAPQAPQPRCVQVDLLWLEHEGGTSQEGTRSSVEPWRESGEVLNKQHRAVAGEVHVRLQDLEPSTGALRDQELAGMSAHLFLFLGWAPTTRL